MRFISSFLLAFVLVFQLRAQEFILNDQKLVDQINETLDLIYNYQFNEADREIEKLERLLGNHPAPHLLRSMILYWRDRPFKADTEAYKNYIYELETAIGLATPFQDDEILREEGEFYILAGYGLMTDFYNEAGFRMKAVGSARKAYSSLKEGFDLKEKFPDFYFSTGIYNYYREKFPEIHPFYKAFLWLFVGGDMELGLEQLKVAAEKGVFTQREALIYLFHLYLRYENKPPVALPYAEILVGRFPGNYRFKTLYIEALLFNRNDSIPEEMINSLLKHENRIYQLAGQIFSGLMAEQRMDLKAATEHLETAMSIYEGMNREYEHYLSLIYTGMARLCLRENDHEGAANYYKLAIKCEPYVPVKDEAERYLNLVGDE